MKNITIHEGTEPKNLSVDKLVTALTDGGSATWVPEDETQLSHLTATRNGRYRPASGFYGFSNVDVYVDKTYPRPGDTTPIKPAENNVQETATLIMIGIAGGGSIELKLPKIEIRNAEKEGVVNMVDFSNAKIEIMNVYGLSINSYLTNTVFTDENNESVNGSSSYTHYSFNDKYVVIHYGKFTVSGNCFYFGYSRCYKVTGVQFSAGDTYSFEIVVHFRETTEQ